MRTKLYVAPALSLILLSGCNLGGSDDSNTSTSVNSTSVTESVTYHEPMSINSASAGVIQKYKIWFTNKEEVSPAGGVLFAPAQSYGDLKNPIIQSGTSEPIIYVEAERISFQYPFQEYEFLRGVQNGLIGNHKKAANAYGDYIYHGALVGDLKFNYKYKKIEPAKYTCKNIAIGLMTMPDDGMFGLTYKNDGVYTEIFSNQTPGLGVLNYKSAKWERAKPITIDCVDSLGHYQEFTISPANKYNDNNYQFAYELKPMDNDPETIGERELSKKVMDTINAVPLDERIKLYNEGYIPPTVQNNVIYDFFVYDPTEISFENKHASLVDSGTGKHLTSVEPTVIATGIFNNTLSTPQNYTMAGQIYKNRKFMRVQTTKTVNQSASITANIPIPKIGLNAAFNLEINAFNDHITESEQEEILELPAQHFTDIPPMTKLVVKARLRKENVITNYDFSYSLANTIIAKGMYLYYKSPVNQYLYSYSHTNGDVSLYNAFMTAQANGVEIPSDFTIIESNGTQLGKIIAAGQATTEIQHGLEYVIDIYSCPATNPNDHSDCPTSDNVSVQSNHIGTANHDSKYKHETYVVKACVVGTICDVQHDEIQHSLVHATSDCPTCTIHHEPQH